MKKSSHIGYLVAVALLIPLFASCDSMQDNFEEMNTDPSAANVLDPAFQLTYIQLTTSGERYENWRTNLIFSSTMIQHFATLPTYWVGDKYLHNGGYSAALWDRYYPNVVRNIQDLVARTADSPEDVNLNAIARIWRVVFFHRLTDLYGDVPYFKAGMGALMPDDPETKTPPYDPQQEIYADMLNELLEAGDALDSSQPSYGGGDLIYGGDTDRWYRFANSMMLRLGLRMIKVDPGLSQQWAERAISRGVMTSNADIAYVPHTDGPEGVNMNGNGEVFAADGSPRLSKTFVDWMLAHNDPRLAVYGSLPNGDTDPANAKGLPNGFDATTIKDYVGGDDLDTYTEPNRALITQRDDPMFFQTYAEVEFMLAEAAVRGWAGAGDPATHYANGVRAAMSYLSMYDSGGGADIPSADVDAYLAANPYDAANALEQINTQYWAAVLLNEYEAFANWRRTGYPVLTPTSYPGNVTNGTIPRRLRYPGGEAASNAANYEAAVARQGPDEYTTRMWWDTP